MKLSTFINRSWWKTTLLVIAAAAVMVRLGVWQLDRLEQRRVFNARVLEQQAQPTLELTGQAVNDPELAEMEYRQVIVKGEYEPSHQVVLRNQVWQNESGENEIGVHILTPLKIVGSDEYVLVNRGWVPLEDFQNDKLSQYDESGVVLVKGIIRAPQARPQIGGRADPIPKPGEPPLLAWNVANIPAIAAQTPYPLLPVYIQEAPDKGWTRLPYRSLPELDLTEGPHLGYAYQWFTFAALLVFGYPFYIRRQESDTMKNKNEADISQVAAPSLQIAGPKSNGGGK